MDVTQNIQEIEEKIRKIRELLRQHSRETTAISAQMERNGASDEELRRFHDERNVEASIIYAEREKLYGIITDEENFRKDRDNALDNIEKYRIAISRIEELQSYINNPSVSDTTKAQLYDGVRLILEDLNEEGLIEDSSNIEDTLGQLRKELNRATITLNSVYGNIDRSEFDADMKKLQELQEHSNDAQTIEANKDRVNNLISKLSAVNLDEKRKEEAKNQNESLIAKNKELEELKKEIEAKDATVKSLEEERRKLQQERKTIDQEIDETRNLLVKSRKNKDKTEDDEKQYNELSETQKKNLAKREEINKRLNEIGEENKKGQTTKAGLLEKARMERADLNIKATEIKNNISQILKNLLHIFNIEEQELNYLNGLDLKDNDGNSIEFKYDLSNIDLLISALSQENEKNAHKTVSKSVNEEALEILAKWGASLRGNDYVAALKAREEEIKGNKRPWHVQIGFENTRPVGAEKEPSARPEKSNAAPEPGKAPEQKPAPGPKPTPEPGKVSEPKPAPGPKPTPEPGPASEPKPAPEPRPVSEPRPTSGPRPAPEQKPTPGPRPSPEPVQPSAPSEFEEMDNASQDVIIRDGNSLEVVQRYSGEFTLEDVANQERGKKIEQGKFYRYVQDKNGDIAYIKEDIQPYLKNTRKQLKQELKKSEKLYRNAPEMKLNSRYDKESSAYKAIASKNPISRWMARADVLRQVKKGSIGEIEMLLALKSAVSPGEAMRVMEKAGGNQYEKGKSDLAYTLVPAKGGFVKRKINNIKQELGGLTELERLYSLGGIPSYTNVSIPKEDDTPFKSPISRRIRLREEAKAKAQATNIDKNDMDDER